MKRKLLSIFLFLFGLFILASCKNEQPVEEVYYDSIPTDIDHYFSNQVRFSDTGITVEKNKDGKLAGDFIKDKVAKLAPKSITDGDTAVFHLDKYDSSATNDSYTSPIGKSYSYLTVRFLGVDTPESTSSIDAWGKAASNYAKSLLENAEGIIVDATDCGDEIKAGARLDSNGTRWLGLVWYCPDGGNPEDLSQYRLYELDLIEECYSRYTGGISDSKIAYNADKNEEPILYSRYADTFGSLSVSDLLLEAEVRMTDLELRIHGQKDPNFDYSNTPTLVSITEALENISNPNNPNNYMNKGTLVQIEGVILRYIGNNFYLQDKQGSCLYVYMGIEGNSIESLYKVGDTISIQGRLCEYGGQYQMSGVVFKRETFNKIEGENAVAMPEPYQLKGNETTAELKQLLGKLVTTEFELSSIGSKSKDGSYTLYSKTSIPDLTAIGYQYDTLSVRINGSLAPGYDSDSFTRGKKYRVTGVLGVYSEMDLQEEQNIPSYQIIPGNRPVEDNVVVNEIVQIN